MRKTWLTLVIILAGGLYFWPGDEPPPKSADTRLPPQASGSAHPYNRPAYPPASQPHQGWNEGSSPAYMDGQRQNNYPAQAEYRYGGAGRSHPRASVYQYGQPQNSTPAPFQYGQYQAGPPPTYPYGQSLDSVQTRAGYQYGQPQNHFSPLKSYPGQPRINHTQRQDIGQSSYYQDTQGYQPQSEAPPAFTGWQQPPYSAGPAGNGYSKESYNPGYRGQMQKPGDFGYKFRPLEKKKSVPKRWTGNYMQAPGYRHHTPPPTRDLHSPEQHQAPWRQPGQLYENNSLWAAH